MEPTKGVAKARKGRPNKIADNLTTKAGPPPGVNDPYIRASDGALTDPSSIGAAEHDAAAAAPSTSMPMPSDVAAIAPLTAGSATGVAAADAAPPVILSRAELPPLAAQSNTNEKKHQLRVEARQWLNQLANSDGPKSTLYPGDLATIEVAAARVKRLTGIEPAAFFRYKEGRYLKKHRLGPAVPTIPGSFAFMVTAMYVMYSHVPAMESVWQEPVEDAAARLAKYPIVEYILGPMEFFTVNEAIRVVATISGTARVWRANEAQLYTAVAVAAFLPAQTT